MTYFPDEIISTHKKAKINSKIVDYAVYSSLRFNVAYSETVFEYIGEGEIYSIDGVRQLNLPGTFHFWKYKEHE
jgi:hypothetical protein